MQQGTDKNHAALQGLKSFLGAITDVNDISSRGNNQIVQRICDYYSVCLSSVHRYIYSRFLTSIGALREETVLTIHSGRDRAPRLYN